MNKRFFKLFFISCFLFLSSPVSAANPSDVVINEIAWMGTNNSYNDEWIELYNNTDSLINLKEWTLKAVDGTPEINLTGTILNNGFYLLERTDDTTVPGIFASQIYKGALGNSGENLELYNNSGRLIDSVDCSSGWFAGDNKTKQTMERKDSRLVGSWVTSQSPGGTPRNSIAAEIETLSEEPVMGDEQEVLPEFTEPELEAQPEPQEKIKITYPSGIIINEVLPSPTGPDSQGEWVEIFNQNDFEVDLSNWQLSDTEGNINVYTMPQGTKISSQGFLVLDRTTTKIVLNNGGDGLNLIQPDGSMADEIIYEKAPQGQSYNQTVSQWLWSASLTPGLMNIVSIPVLKDEKVKSSVEETEKPLVQKETGKDLAAIRESIPQSQNKPLYTLLAALFLAAFSAIIILVLKKKLGTKL